MITEIEIIGLIAGVLTSGALVPQVIQVYKTKQTRDLNLNWLVSLWIGTLLWLIYGLSIISLSLVIFNGISLFIVGYLVYKKMIGQPIIRYHLLSEFFDQKTTPTTNKRG